MQLSKERRISSTQQEISFKSSKENYSLVRQTFLRSDLGLIYTAIPWLDLVKCFGLYDKARGPRSMFSPQGKIALMFLKNYSGCSDKRLIEQFNGNVHYQLFCDMLLEPGDSIDNHKIVSQIRTELGRKLDIEKMQKTLASHWLENMDETYAVLMDATCYESYVRYPTNVKLLFECVMWSFDRLKRVCKELGIRTPRSKFIKWMKRYGQYSKKRRRSKKETRSISRGLLGLLKKYNIFLSDLESQTSFSNQKSYLKKRKTIELVYQQQHQLFTTGEKPKNRIISLDKDYLRPIVRGKETKLVEFGAKVNKIQINGINFIEHINFEAFHEGIRLKNGVLLAQTLTHTKTKVLGADALYATNMNRSYCSKNQIKTDFVRKGRASKHEHQRKALAATIKKERASRLEGSFGNEKENYYLSSIKARTKPNEILWIFCGIHTANALEIGRRKREKNLQKTG